jgi:hypothetical protein
MLLAISLTRVIESGTIVASPAMRVGMHLALPLPQLQGSNCGIFPPLYDITEIRYGLVVAEIGASKAGGEGDVATNRMGVSRRGTS